MAIATVRISEDIVPISKLKAQAAELLRRVGEGNRPLVITQNGKAAGVLLSPAAFDRLSERARLVAAVEEGLADADAGRVSAHDEVAARMKARFSSRRSR
ncbi:MAG: type II toxin-antitoxin system prevent-host-death family antitoxin [Byssovorax sp.]